MRAEPPSVTHFRTSFRHAVWWVVAIAVLGAAPGWLRQLHAARPALWLTVVALLLVAAGIVTVRAVQVTRRGPPGAAWRQLGLELIIAWGALLGLLASSARPAA